MGIQSGQFERIVECRARYCLWFWLSCCFCEPYTAFVVGKRLGMKQAVWRFLVFGISLLVFRIILNNVADNFMQVYLFLIIQQALKLACRSSRHYKAKDR